MAWHFSTMIENENSPFDHIYMYTCIHVYMYTCTVHCTCIAGLSSSNLLFALGTVTKQLCSNSVQSAASLCSNWPDEVMWRQRHSWHHPPCSTDDGLPYVCTCRVVGYTKHKWPTHVIGTSDTYAKIITQNLGVESDGQLKLRTLFLHL